MAIINRRNTIQRTLILEAVRLDDGHPSAEEIYSAVSEKCPAISKGTVYRNLNMLADEGEIQRVAVANAPDRFDHTLGDHCHLLCLGCGKVIDLPFVPDIDMESLCIDGNTIVGFDMVFRGYCASCNTEKS